MRSIRQTLFALVATVTLAGASSLSAQVTVDTYTGWNGTDYYFPLGVDGTDAYGQVFQAPAQYLNSWSFWLRENSGGANETFTANVGTWTGSAVGSVLWTSGIFAGTSSAGWQQYTFNTGGVSLLTGGESYIFFLDALTGPGTMGIGARYDAPYGGGNFVFQNGTDHTSDWDGLTGSDLAFIASFDRVPSGGEEVVPEPATMTLLATGLFGMAGAARRKRRSA
ncbi:MAG: PEP-CTERM sorting domain-containing protein [Gemmatimonadota bacterium]